MNRLINKAPKELEINGKAIPITTDYRICLETINEFSDSEQDDIDKIESLLYDIYLEGKPEEEAMELMPFIWRNAQECIEKALWFLRGGEDYKEEQKKPVYCDLEQDSGYVFSAFLKLGVDLDTTDYLHWWTFLSRMSELPECMFTRIMYLRRQHATGKATKEEKKEMQRIGMDVIKIRAKRNKKKEEENSNYFAELKRLIKAVKDAQYKYGSDSDEYRLAVQEKEEHINSQ